MVSRRWPTRELKEMKEESTSGGCGFGGGGAEGHVGGKNGASQDEVGKSLEELKEMVVREAQERMKAKKMQFLREKELWDEKSGRIIEPGPRRVGGAKSGGTSGG